MRDYVGCILHMIPDLTPWHLRPLDVNDSLCFLSTLLLTPRKEIRDKSHDIAPRGEGNVCSVEFNLLYRVSSFTLYTSTPADCFFFFT